MAHLQGYLAHRKMHHRRTLGILGPCRRHMPRVLGGSWGLGRFLKGRIADDFARKVTSAAGLFGQVVGMPFVVRIIRCGKR